MELNFIMQRPDDGVGYSVYCPELGFRSKYPGYCKDSAMGGFLSDLFDHISSSIQIKSEDEFTVKFQLNQGDNNATRNPESQD